jgi:AAHS family 4-hydroxybenzoate transporter-like MFS transporter
MPEQSAAVIARSGVHLRVVAVCFLVTFIDGYDTLMLAFIAPLISREWTLSPAMLGQIFASGYAGAALGALTLGIAGDRFGRKRLLLVSLAIAGGFTGACAAVTDASQLMLLRFLAGIGLGGALPATSALSAEQVASEHRAATVTRVFLGFPVGAMIGGTLTALVMHTVGWRGVFAGTGVFALLLVPLVGVVVRECQAARLRPGKRMGRFGPLRTLVAEKRGLPTVLLCLSVFLILLVTYFLISWTPTMLTLVGLSPQRAAMSSVLLNVGGLAGALVLSLVLDRRGPFFVVAICFTAGASLVALLAHNASGNGMAALALVSLIGLFIIGAQATIPALCVRLYPVEVRGTGVGLSMACGRLGSIAGPLIAGYLMSAHRGWREIFLLASAVALLAAVAMSGIGVSQGKANR